MLLPKNSSTHLNAKWDSFFHFHLFNNNLDSVAIDSPLKEFHSYKILFTKNIGNNSYRLTRLQSWNELTFSFPLHNCFRQLNTINRLQSKLPGLLTCSCYWWRMIIFRPRFFKLNLLFLTIIQIHYINSISFILILPIQKSTKNQKL